MSDPQREKNDSKRSVFIFSVPKEALDSKQIRELMEKFKMKRAYWTVPVYPQTYSFLYLTNDPKPNGFPYPNAYNYSEVISNVSTPTT